MYTCTINGVQRNIFINILAALLAAFILNRHTSVSYTHLSEQQFVDKIFDDDSAETEEGVVFLYISYLRAKLNAIGANVTISTTDDNRYVLNTPE